MGDAVYTFGLRRVGEGNTEGDRALDEVALRAARDTLGEPEEPCPSGEPYDCEVVSSADKGETAVYCEVWVLVGTGDPSEAVSRKSRRALQARTAHRVLRCNDRCLRADVIILQFDDPARVKTAKLHHYVGVAEWNV